MEQIEDIRRRLAGAKKLLADVQERVIGLVEAKLDGGLEVSSHVSEEIDAGWSQLEELEAKLTRTVGEDDEVPNLGNRSDLRKGRDSPQDTTSPQDTADDDLYATVGAAVRKGKPIGAYCPHCRQDIEPDDNFCRRCGHHLRQGPKKR